MTREEAKYELANAHKYFFDDERLDEAIDMAIKALSAEPSNLMSHDEAWGVIDGDLISRADAMNKCKNAENELTDEAERKGLRVARFIIGEMPSADAVSREDADMLVGLRNFKEYIRGYNDATAVAVEVVRCKDCKYRDPEDERCDHGAVNFLLRRTDKDYCSYGERKGGDDE